MSWMHKHTFKAFRMEFERYIGGGTATFLVVQCETCGKPKRSKIASFTMTTDEVETYVAANFKQVSDGV